MALGMGVREGAVWSILVCVAGSSPECECAGVGGQVQGVSVGGGESKV